MGLKEQQAGGGKESRASHMRSQELQSSDVLQLKSTMAVHSQKNTRLTEHARKMFHLELRSGFDTNGELIVLKRDAESDGGKKFNMRQYTRRRRQLRR
jgi:hypothetical protein